MNAKERMLWEQAAQVLRRNSVTVSVEPPRAKQILDEKASEQVAPRRRRVA
jgi:hypothetical protein